MKHKKRFVVILTEDEEEPEILNVTVPDLPGCLTWGYGRQEALKNAKEAIELYLSVTDNEGEPTNSEMTEVEVAA